MSTNAEEKRVDRARKKRIKKLEDYERAIEDSYNTGKADRAKITQGAQLDAAEAVAMVGIAMEADEEADEARRITLVAERSGDRDRAKRARQRERQARKKANADHRAATRSAKQAYDAIKFSAPNKMGFLRAVYVMFALHIVFELIFLLVTSRDAMVYDVSTIMDWIMVILEGVAFWMFYNRYKLARPLVMGMAVFGMVVPIVFDLMAGAKARAFLTTNSVFYLFLLLYFAFSKRVKSTLVNDFSRHRAPTEQDELVIDRRGWPFARNLIMYFIVFSVLGHWMEMAMCQLIIAGLVQGEYDPTNTMLWRDWLYPFPMEGAAVVVIGLALYPFYQWLKKTKPLPVAYAASFVSNALLCTVIEFGMGLIVNADLQLWDYTDNFCNIMGQVCLQNTMAFGVAASLITWFVYPTLERWIARVPRDVMNIAFVVVLLFGAIIWSLYIFDPPAYLTETEDDSDLELVIGAKPKRLEGESDADYEKRIVLLDLSYLEMYLETLEKDIATTQNLQEKAELEQQAQQIRQRIEVIMSILGTDTLPDDAGQIQFSLEETPAA